MTTPSTIVRLLENVDISSNYVNTFSFSSLSAQSSFFISKTKANCTFSDFVFQRKEGTIKVSKNVESLWNVKYLMFQNSNFSNKWFYAFVTDMKFLNDSTTEIFFEIDVIQTWLFDMAIKDCYIEREHVVDDTIGLHQVEEGLNIGEPIIISSTPVSELNDIAIIVSSTSSVAGDDIVGSTITGIYTGTGYYGTDDIDFVNDFKTALDGLGKGDAINNVFTMPKNLIANFENPYRINQAIATKINISTTKNLTTIDGYTPKNKKLLCYPYNFLNVCNNRGDASIYKYELSSSSTMDFYVSCNIAPDPTVYLIPKFYRGLAENYEEFMTITGYPMCSWTNDIYKNWVSQNAVSNTTAVMGSILSLGVGVATGNPIGVASGVLGVANSIGSFYEKSLQPNPIKGNVSGGGNVALGIQNFTMNKKCVRQEFAKIIDNYFDRFGYKVNELKTPNLKSRANWNYIKTIENNIFGSIPNNDLKKIDTIFKNGITFWHNDNVGNYNRTNSTV